jgi:hypothetical protein
MNFVLDASVAAVWFFPDEDDSAAISPVSMLYLSMMPAISSWRVATRCRSRHWIVVLPPQQSKKGSISFSDAERTWAVPAIRP